MNQPFHSPLSGKPQHTSSFGPPRNGPLAGNDRSSSLSRLSIMLNRSTVGLHCNAVSCTFLDTQYQPDSLFTASRDGFIKKWDISHLKPQLMYNLAEHSHWVNDSVLVPDPTKDIVVSCSDDKLIKVWCVPRDDTSPRNSACDNGEGVNSNDETSPFSHESVSGELGVHDAGLNSAYEPKGVCPLLRSTATLRFHTDYVMCLSCASLKSEPLLASGGLDGLITVFNLNVAAPMVSFHSALRTGVTRSGNQTPDEFYKPRRRIYMENLSIWALQISQHGTTLCHADSKKNISLWDTRSLERIHHLPCAHDGVIRQLRLSGDATKVLSASSDCTAKTWDLRLSKSPFGVFTTHTDSVWALWSDLDVSDVFVTGGRDHKLYVHNMATGQSALMGTESSPIVSLCGDSDRRVLWVSTLDSNVHRWRMRPNNSQLKMGIADHNRFPIHVPVGAAIKGVNGRQKSLTSGAHKSASHSADEGVGIRDYKIPGLPKVCEYHVLRCQQFALVKDMVGGVDLWNLVMGTLVKAFGPGADMKQLRKTLDVNEPAPVWFTSDNTLGSFRYHLDGRNSFKAEGRLVLPGEMLAGKLKRGKSGGEVESSPSDSSCSPSATGINRSTKVNYGVFVCESLFPDQFARGKASQRESKKEGTEVMDTQSPWSRHSFPPLTIIVLCNEQSGPVTTVFDKNYSPSQYHNPVVKFAFTLGRDVSDSILPSWLRECIAGEIPNPPDYSDVRVTLTASASSDLPQLEVKCLTCRRDQALRTVMNFLLSRLNYDWGDSPTMSACTPLSGRLFPNRAQSKLKEYNRNAAISADLAWPQAPPVAETVLNGIQTSSAIEPATPGWKVIVPARFKAVFNDYKVDPLPVTQQDTQPDKRAESCSVASLHHICTDECGVASHDTTTNDSKRRKQPGIKADNYIAITCRGTAISPDESMGTVRDVYWATAGPIELTYHHALTRR